MSYVTIRQKSSILNRMEYEKRANAHLNLVSQFDDIMNAKF